MNKIIKHRETGLSEIIHRQPVRVAQRVLREFGGDAERVVENWIQAGEERRELLEIVKQQRQRFEVSNWNKGYVRTY